METLGTESACSESSALASRSFDLGNDRAIEQRVLLPPALGLHPKHGCIGACAFRSTRPSYLGQSLAGFCDPLWPRFRRLFGYYPCVFPGSRCAEPMPDSNSVPTSEMTRDNWYELLAWVKASDRRVEILTSLAESPKNTRDFAESWNITLEGVRHHLNQLEAGGPEGKYPPLIKVLTPNRRKNKLYGNTKAGSDIAGVL